jgi:predicted transcriptional regulator
LYGRLQQELGAREKSPGLTMSDLLDMPDDQRQMINLLMRQKIASLADLARLMDREEAAARDLLTALVEQGLVREFEQRGVLRYQVRLAPKRGRTMPANLWQALDDKVEG